MRLLLSKLQIRTKLIGLFIVIKVIPVVLFAVISLYGVRSLYNFFNEHTTKLKEATHEVVSSTAAIAVEDSILALDRKMQTSLEKLGAQIARSLADFLYERDNDLLLLASLPRSEQTYANFFKHKHRAIIQDKSDDYIYDDASEKWVRAHKAEQESVETQARLKDNEREFHKVDPIAYDIKKVPLYKEIVFFDLQGNEQIKISSLHPDKTNVSHQENTYIKAETYYPKIQLLKKGEIYVSDVIGAYVPSRIIGVFNKAKAKKAGIPFEPWKHGYGGRENPVGKRFEGIVRFITPVFDGDEKVGFVSLALDHRHIMEFTDAVDPLNYSLLDASAPSEGNYAFMWDYKGRSISHVRDYFITGFDPKTGKRVTPWLSREVEEAFIASGKEDLGAFLETYPSFNNQSLAKKPSQTSIEKGEVGIDCRYLNFAPQCQGWMQLTENGGLGSFIIFWSKVWKLTTAASIPYYTGQYGDSPRGFGFITIGANVDEFHKAAQQTKEELDGLLAKQLGFVDKMIAKAAARTKEEVDYLLNELTLVTLIMVLLMMFVAIWLSNLLRSRLHPLLRGAKEVAANNLEYRISVDSEDEIGELAQSFNEMAEGLQQYIAKEKEHNQLLEQRIGERTKQLTVLNEQIQKQLNYKEKQEEKLKIYAEIFASTTDAIVITDVSGVILSINHAFIKITGYTEEDIIGKTNRELKSHRHLPEFYRDMWQTILSKQTWEGEVWNRRKDGSLYPALLCIVPILNNQGDISFFAGILHDVSEIKKNEERLHRQAYYDPLTKLANRALGYDRLEQAIISAERQDTKIAVLFLDLDKFKQVNDTLGHDTGDLLLCEVGHRLSSLCKQTDTVSRLGGDEFLLIIEDVQQYEEVIVLVEKIIQAMAKPFALNEQIIHTSTSVGITFYPDDGNNVRQLLKNSDIAMYRAKAKGRGVYELFTSELGLQVKEAVLLEQALKEAVEKQEFVMYYQPILDVKNREVVGLEALLRWQQGDTLRYPNTFIDMLEKSRLIIDATESVLPNIFHFSKKLSQRYDKQLTIAINISAAHFVEDTFSDRLIELVQQGEVASSNICLELTETIFLEDMEIVSRKLTELKRMGFQIALDDFGTGYSSLGYLKGLPLDKIKIDRIFTKELPDSKGDVAITTSVCLWGENFGLDVVAEGVETERQLAFLEEMGCDQVQGYLFAKPMDEKNLIKYLDEKMS